MTQYTMSENPFIISQTQTEALNPLNSDIVLELDLEVELDSDDTLYSKSHFSQITNQTPTPTRRSSTSASASQLCMIQSTPKYKPATNRNNILKLIHILYTRKFASNNKQNNDNRKQSSRDINDKSNKSKDKSIVQAYNKYEEKILLKLETFISYIDNFIAFQAIFPTVYRQTKTLKVLKPIGWIFRQFSKIYIIVILINLKRFLQRFIKLQKLIKTLETEYLLINQNYKMNNESNELNSTHKETLLVLYTEKFKSIVEIFGYFNDLLLNLNLVSKRFKLNKILDRFVGFMSWIISIYRFSKDEDEELKNEKIIDDLEKKYNFS